MALPDGRLTDRSPPDPHTGRDRFRAEFQRRLPPAYHDLANTDLQLFAIVRHSSIDQWHNPVPETYPPTPARAQGADQ